MYRVGLGFYGMDNDEILGDVLAMGKKYITLLL